MPNREPDDELLATALGGTHNCPPLQDLERLLQQEAPESLKRHVDACSHCRTELEMLRLFTSNEVAKHERPAVDSIAARLRARQAGFSTVPTAADKRRSWWNRILPAPWLAPAAVALAVLVVVAGVTVELRRGKQPALDTTSVGPEVLRSSAIMILSPIGDVRQKPAQISWEAAPNAARYWVRIMEVDRTELWSTETTAPRVDLPPNVEALIVPAKTLLIQVEALNAARGKIAESETTRFRLLQNVYTP